MFDKKYQRAMNIIEQEIEFVDYLYRTHMDLAKLCKDDLRKIEFDIAQKYLANWEELTYLKRKIEGP